MFSSCDRLEELILSGNQLSSLAAYSFPALSFLTKIDLSHNVIAHISPKAFLNLGHSVKTLDLRGNLLVTLHGQLLLPVYKVQVNKYCQAPRKSKLNVSQNVFSCSLLPKIRIHS